MRNDVKLIGDDNDGWNVEVKMGDNATAVFACDDKEAAEELLDRISECSWFQIEKR